MVGIEVWFDQRSIVELGPKQTAALIRFTNGALRIIVFESGKLVLAGIPRGEKDQELREGRPYNGPIFLEPSNFSSNLVGPEE